MPQCLHPKNCAGHSQNQKLGLIVFGELTTVYCIENEGLICVPLMTLYCDFSDLMNLEIGLASVEYIRSLLLNFGERLDFAIEKFSQPGCTLVENCFRGIVLVCIGKYFLHICNKHLKGNIILI